jgi:hypothetical protein
VAYPYLASRGTLLDVQADQFWQDTGVQVQAGDRITVLQVGGEWTNTEGEVAPVDANGDAAQGLYEERTLPSAYAGTLIGKIGEDEGHVFPVGRWGIVTAPAAGSLYLAMNDSDYDDNAGFVTVQIVVERAEE